jgi:hypothetical protein
MDRAYILKFLDFLQPPLLEIRVGWNDRSDGSMQKSEEVLEYAKTGESLFIYVKFVCLSRRFV